MHTNMFLMYIKRTMEEVLEEHAARFVEEHSDELDICQGYRGPLSDFEYAGYELTSAELIFQEGLLFSLKVDMRLTIYADDSDGCREEYWPYISIWFDGNLETEPENWKFKKTTSFTKQRIDYQLDSDFLPMMKTGDLDKYSKLFLELYFKDALKVKHISEPAVKVDPFILANILKLNVLKHPITQDKSLYGQIYFDSALPDYCISEGESNYGEPVESGTIVYDPDVFFFQNIGNISNTIVHECVHWVFHRKAYVFAKKMNSLNLSHISCGIVGGTKDSFPKDIRDRMEWQANKLTPRILMPEVPFKTRAYEYIKRYELKEGGNECCKEIDIIEIVIEKLSEDYGVSKQSAKIRMMEIGIEAAAGAMIYLDNDHVAPYTYKKGSIKETQTFSLSYINAAIAWIMSPDLQGKTESGDYIFVDHHYIFNAPVYVSRDENGYLKLTDYARNHMDECCLVFDIAYNENHVPHWYPTEFLARQTKKTPSYCKYSGEVDKDKEREEKVKAQIAKKQSDDIMLQGINDDVNQSFTHLLKCCNMTIEGLSFEIRYNEKSIDNIKTGKSKATLKTAALICFGLHLSYTVSNAFMCCLGWPIESLKTEEAKTLRWALSSLAGESVEYVVSVLYGLGVTFKQWNDSTDM